MVSAAAMPLGCNTALQPLPPSPPKRRDKKPSCLHKVDDNYGNCVKAQEFGWNTAHLVEDDAPIPKTQASKYQIRHLEDLRTVFPQFFKKA